MAKTYKNRKGRGSKKKSRKEKYKDSASLILRDSEKILKEEIDMKKITDEIKELDDLLELFNLRENSSKQEKRVRKFNSRKKKLLETLKDVQRTLKNTERRIKSNSMNVNKFRRY